MEQNFLLKEKFLEEINKYNNQEFNYEIDCEYFDVILNKQENENKNLFICLNKNLTLSFDFLEEEIYLKSSFSKDISLKEMNKLKLIMKEVKKTIKKLFFNENLNNF